MNYSVLYTEYISDSISVDIFNWNSEGILLRISDCFKLGLYGNIMLGVDNFYKLREELSCMVGESLRCI